MASKETKELMKELYKMLKIQPVECLEEAAKIIVEEEQEDGVGVHHSTDPVGDL